MSVTVTKPTFVQVNGSAFNHYIKATGSNVRKAERTAWRKACRICDSHVLGCDLLGNDCGYAFPFLCSDGAWRNLNDFQPSTNSTESSSPIYDFVDLKFTRAALLGAIGLTARLDPTTESVEALGREIARYDQVSNHTILHFCEGEADSVFGPTYSVTTRAAANSPPSSNIGLHISNMHRTTKLPSSQD